MPDTDKGAPAPTLTETETTTDPAAVAAEMRKQASRHRELEREADEMLEKYSSEMSQETLDETSDSSVHHNFRAAEYDRLAAILEAAAARIAELEAALIAAAREPEMRARVRELATGRDDFDRAVLMLLDDFEALKASLLPETGEVGMGEESTDVVIDFLGGNCPVQGEGTINGLPFYFRARGCRWSLAIGGDDPAVNPSWEYGEFYGDTPYDAGWMTEAEARQFITAAAARYAATLAQEERDNAGPD